MGKSGDVAKSRTHCPGTVCRCHPVHRNAVRKSLGVSSSAIQQSCHGRQSCGDVCCPYGKSVPTTNSTTAFLAAFFAFWYPRQLLDLETDILPDFT